MSLVTGIKFLQFVAAIYPSPQLQALLRDLLPVPFFLLWPPLLLCYSAGALLAVRQQNASPLPQLSLHGLCVLSCFSPVLPAHLTLLKKVKKRSLETSLVLGLTVQH